MPQWDFARKRVAGATADILRRDGRYAFTAGMNKPGKADKWAARNQRLAVALRENLKRRKAQAKGRDRARERESADDCGLGAAGLDENAENGESGPEFRRNQGQE